jgi:hypothetical protein
MYVLDYNADVNGKSFERVCVSVNKCVCDYNAAVNAQPGTYASVYVCVGVCLYMRVCVFG